jgi:hypothetical protein
LHANGFSESYEKYPPAYTGFKIAKSPPTGGDTLFVSSYGLYEHLSEPWQKFADGLTATHSAKEFLRFMEKGMTLDGELQRGHPENVGLEFQTSQYASPLARMLASNVLIRHLLVLSSAQTPLQVGRVSSEWALASWMVTLTI